jgi:hypothetical protein
MYNYANPEKQNKKQAIEMIFSFAAAHAQYLAAFNSPQTTNQQDAERCRPRE